MPKFRVTFEIERVVEADDEDYAVEIALERLSLDGIGHSDLIAVEELEED